MTTLCPHGLTAGECLICATLATSPAASAPSGNRRPPSPARKGGGVGVVVVVVVVLLVAWWVAALLSLILRLAGLVAISAGSGWIGWRLGVRHGRRTSRD